MNTLRTTSFGFMLAVALTGCGAAPGEEWTDGSGGGVESSDSNSMTLINGLNLTNGLLLPNGLSLTNGLTLRNGLTSKNGLALSNGLSLANGLALSNGLTLHNGVLLSNGLDLYNGLVLQNGLSLTNGMMLRNGLSLVNGLLQVDGLGQPTVIPNGGDLINSADGRNLLSYVIRCALPSSQSIVRKDSANVSYTFTGQVGLAPEWYSNAAGACTLACEEKVSACLMALTNPTGVHEQIMMGGGGPGSNHGTLLGDNDSCPSGACASGDSLYNEKEGAFWGNLFIQDRPQAYYCQSDFNSLSDNRTCADSTSSSPCPFVPSQDECEDSFSGGYPYNSTTKITKPTQNKEEKYAFTSAISTRIGFSGSSSAGNGWTQLPSKCPATVQTNACIASHTESRTYSYGQSMCTGGTCTYTSGCTKTCTICDQTGTKITDGTSQCVSTWNYPITTWYSHH